MGMNRTVWGRPGSGFPVSVKGGAALLSGCWQFIRKEVNIMKVYCWDAIQFCNYSEQKGQRSKIQIARLSLKFSSVQFSHLVVSNSLQLHGLQHARPPCPSPTPGVWSNLCPLSQWCHPTTSPSVIPFSSHLQSFPGSGLFKWVSFLHQVAKVLEFQLQHQSFLWIFRTDFL